MKNLHARACALLMALGIACVSVALGLIYRDVALRERALARLAAERHVAIESVDADEAWDAWTPVLWLGALASGTAGVAMLALGGTLLVYDLGVLTAKVCRDRAALLQGFHPDDLSALASPPRVRG